jgi:hypothetical protein
MNDPYKPTNPENIVMRGRFEGNIGWLRGKGGVDNDDIGEACPNSEQIAYIRDFGIGPLFFVNEQMAIDNARKQAASLGGDGASVYNLYSFWWILFTTTYARSIVYKCNVGSGKKIAPVRYQEQKLETPKPQKKIINGNEVMYIPEGYMK